MTTEHPTQGPPGSEAIRGSPSEDHPASETPSAARNRSNYGAWLGHDAADAGPESRGLLPHPATGEPYEPSPTSQAWAPSMASTLALV